MNDYIYYYLLAVNILAFVLFGADKQKARRNAWRIPEKTLILSAEYDSLKNEEKAYADKMQKAGGDVTYVEFANCRHGFTHEWFDEFMPEESEKAWNMMAAFIRGIM